MLFLHCCSLQPNAPKSTAPIKKQGREADIKRCISLLYSTSVRIEHHHLLSAGTRFTQCLPVTLGGWLMGMNE